MSKASAAQAKHIIDMLDQRTDTEVQRLIQNGNLLDLLLDHSDYLAKVDRQAFKALLTPPAPTREQLFRGMVEIFDALVERAREHNWPLSDEQLQVLNPRGDVRTSRLNAVLVPDIWLGDLQKTVEELWLWVQDVHARTDKYDGLTFDKKHLKLVNPERYGNQPSVRWVEIDLTANRGRKPRDVRDEHAAGPQLLTAAAVHPDWAKAIDYDAVPAVWLGGLQATLPRGDAWQYVPVLNRRFDSGEVWFDAVWDDDENPHYAVPVFSEL